MTSRTSAALLASALAFALATGCGSTAKSGGTAGASTSASSGSGASSGSTGTGAATSSSSGGTGAGSSSSSASGSSGSSSASSASSSGTAVDPLLTGLVAVQTGVSVDAFDAQILQFAAMYGEPDPMIFKAQIYVESRFDDTAVACPNMPCGVPSGWSPAEAGCFGLMQIVPACGPTPNDVGLLPNGQPNMTTDPTAAGWAGSIFNPSNNIETGIAGVANNRAQVKQQFPGCTEDQYTLMALGNYNSYGSTTSCTQYNTAYDDPLVAAYQTYAAAAHYPAHNYP
jgi:hypothetical protein